MKLKYTIPVAALSCLSFNMGLVQAEPAKSQPALKVEVDQGHQQFGMDLLKSVVKAEPGENAFISPVSASMALDMLTNGASGETRQAMLQAMSLGNVDLDSINQVNYSLIEGLKRKAQIYNETKQWGRKKGDPLTMEIANAIWARNGVEVKPDYAEKIKQQYSGEISTLDFSSDDAANTINGWAAEKTNNKIPKIVSPQNLMGLEMLLANATYFKASWSKAFSPNLTQKADFHMEDGSIHPAQMMQQTGGMSYVLHPDYTAVRLNYVGNAAHMLVMIPKSGTLADFVQNVAAKPETYTEMAQYWKAGKVALRMPKFKFKWEKKLNDALIGFGMGIMFSDVADFSFLSPTALKVSYVKQQTFVQVDETGTEAAAVTSIGMERTTARPRPVIVPINVDKPFFFAIRENEGGNFLFMGTVQKPEFTE